MLALLPLLLGFSSACRGSVVPLLFPYLVGSVADAATTATCPRLRRAPVLAPVLLAHLQAASDFVQPGAGSAAPFR